MVIPLLISCAVNAQTEKAPASVVAGILSITMRRSRDDTLPDRWSRERQACTRCEDVERKARPEIVRLFEENHTGARRGARGLSFEVFDKGTPAFDGKAFADSDGSFSKDPAGAKMAAPK